MSSDDEEEGVTRPAKFQAAKGKPDESAAAQAVDLTEDPQAAQLWATRFIEPADSAGHDEVVYVGTGGQPARQPSRAEQEMQQAVDAQVKELNAIEQHYGHRKVGTRRSVAADAGPTTSAASGADVGVPDTCRQQPTSDSGVGC